MKARKLVLSLVTAGIIASTASVSVSAAQSTTASLASAYGTTQCISLNALTSATASGTSISTSSSNGFSVSTGTAGITTSSIKLTWNKVSGVTGYIVEQYKDGKWVTVKKVTSASTTSHTVTGLSAGTTYNLRVKTYTTKDSKTTYGSPASLQVCTKPAAVTASTTSLTSSSIQVSWNRVAGANGYYIEQYKNGQWVRVGTVASSTTVNYVVKELSPATQYKFRVQAYKSLAGIKYPGAYSSTVSNYTRPEAVIAKLGSVTEKSILITWDRVNGADGYEIEKYEDGKWELHTKIFKPDMLKYSFGSPSSGTTYKIRMRAYKTVGSNTYYGTYSSILSTTTKLDKVYGKTSSATSNSITLSWDKTNGANGYYIEQYKGNGKWVRIGTIIGSSTTYKVTGLTSATQYWFRVQAYKNVDGAIMKSPYSDNLSDFTRPETVKVVEAGSSNSVIVFAWTEVPRVTGYIVEQYRDGKWVQVDKITSSKNYDNGWTSPKYSFEWYVKSLKSSTSYKIRVRAYKTVAGKTYYGAYSSAITGKTADKSIKDVYYNFIAE